MIYSELPVYKQKEKILSELDKNRVIVVESPTGSGKTTQIPVILHEAGYSQSGMIGVTQPRRIATLSVSEFISKQIGTELSAEVGYKMRFEDKTSSKTLIKIMTDGILLQEMKTDKMLAKYSVIMVDEAHERSLNIDFILGLLKNLLNERDDLKIVISSATINSSIFSNYFNNCPIVKIDTPVYPIEMIYEPLPDRAREEEIYKQVTSIVTKHVNNSEKSGDILIFMQGERNIKESVKMLSNCLVKESLFILPLYGRLSKEEQERVFIPTPEGKTKVVISTNIAETSVTIEGITAVIDPGLAKINFYNPFTFASALIEQRISQASANQRRGRAGRTGPGSCYRLYTKNDFDHREEYTTEEIYRTDLSEVILRMSELGIHNFEDFDYISPPTKEGIKGAIETLLMLDAIDEKMQLTAIGAKMVYFPLSPRHARMLVLAILAKPTVLEEILIACAFLSGHTPFLLPQGEEMEARLAHHSFQDNYGDFVSYLKIYKRFKQSKNRDEFCSAYYLDIKTMGEIENIKNQLEEMVGEMGIPILNGGGIRDYLLTVATGLIQFVCVNYRQNSYRSLTAEKIAIHPGSVMFKERPRYLVAGELVKTSKMFARSVSPLKKEWIEKLDSNLVKKLNVIASSKEDDTRDRNKNQKSQTKKDSSWSINIGKETIELKPFKGKKKMAYIGWATAKKLSGTLSYRDFLQYNKLRGTIIYQGKSIFFNHKLPNLFLAARFIDPDKDIISEDIQGSWFAAQSPMELVKRVDWILKLTKHKKNSLAVITLNTNGEGNFWLSPSPSFMRAIDNSINSLDYLIEEIYSLIGDKEREKINSVFRRLSEISETRYK